MVPMLASNAEPATVIAQLEVLGTLLTTGTLTVSEGFLVELSFCVLFPEIDGQTSIGSASIHVGFHIIDKFRIQLYKG